MKNEKKLILTEQIGMGLIAIIMVLSMVFLPKLINNVAYADFNEIVSSQYAVVNFNQIYNGVDTNYASYFDVDNSTNSIYVNTTPTSYGQACTISGIQLINGHKYYASGHGLSLGNIGTPYITLGTIYNSISDVSLNRILISESTDLVEGDTIYINVFDLTAMFGSQNDNLTIEQCKDLFIGDFYPYNSGTPVSLNGLNSYAEGVASVYGNSVHLNEQYFYNNISEIRLNDVTGGYAKYINNNLTPTFSLNIDDHVIFNLPTTLKAGTLFKLSFYLGRSEYNDNTPLEVGYLIQGQFYSLTRVIATAQFDNYNYFELDLTAPYDINGIVFNIPRDYELNDPNYQWYSVHIGDINLRYYINNLQQLISESIEYGREKYKDELDTYYAIGGQGYETIYQAGVRDSQSNMAVFTDSWAFIGNAFRGVGDLLKIELFPNVPIGLFVAFPLLLGLIFFIVKLTKGGS